MVSKFCAKSYKTNKRKVEVEGLKVVSRRMKKKTNNQKNLQVSVIFLSSRAEKNEFAAIQRSVFSELLLLARAKSLHDHARRV